LQALLNEDDAQTQQQFADQLNVTREAVSIHLKFMGKKMGKWVPQLNERQQENRKMNYLRNAARQVQKKVIFPSNCDWR